MPYDREGRRSKTARMWLDLSSGAKVKLTDGHNIQGARQPAYIHIGADMVSRKKRAVKRKEEQWEEGYPSRKNGPGHGFVVRREGPWVKSRKKTHRMAYVLQVEGVNMLLGEWWIAAAQRGGLPTLPVVNLEPAMESE